MRFVRSTVERSYVGSSPTVGAVFFGDESGVYDLVAGKAHHLGSTYHFPRCREGLRMILLLHALIPCLSAYILPSPPVLLHIYCPHPLFCCIYTALIPCLAAYILPSPPPLAAYILPSFPVLLHAYTLLFGTIIPTSFNI